MSVACLFWKLSSYTMYIVCSTCPSSRSDADLFENCKVVYRSRCHITYSPDSILLSIAFGTENPILYCCNYILLGCYYTYWSYYTYWLIFFPDWINYKYILDNLNKNPLHCFFYYYVCICILLFLLYVLVGKCPSIYK